jgi:hypothetical protein
VLVALRLMHVAVLVRSRQIAGLVEYPASRYERVAGAVDQAVTGAGHVLAVAGVIAGERPVAPKIAVVCRGRSVSTPRVAILARGGGYARTGSTRSEAMPAATTGRRICAGRMGASVFCGWYPPSTAVPVSVPRRISNLRGVRALAAERRARPPGTGSRGAAWGSRDDRDTFGTARAVPARC